MSGRFTDYSRLFDEPVPHRDQPDEGLEAAFARALAAEQRQKAEQRKYDDLRNAQPITGGITAEQLAALAVAGIFAKAFIETLGKRFGEGVADLVKTHTRKNGKTTEAEVSVMGVAQVARLIVTPDLPDEARLAVLDLDLTAPELLSKELRWDKATGTWRPSEPLPAEVSSAWLPPNPGKHRRPDPNPGN
jgi:hypothetical protein